MVSTKITALVSAIAPLVLSTSTLAFTPHNIPSLSALPVLIGANAIALSVAYRKHKQLEKAIISSNFKCLNRAGAELKGNEWLGQNRRRIASGQYALVACDVAGMGELNSKIGELAVNRAIASALDEIRSWRGIHMIFQINSGDEFGFFVDRVDVEGISARMDEVFKSAGFKGTYVKSITLAPEHKDCMTAANIAMQEVYELKRQAKG